MNKNRTCYFVASDAVDTGIPNSNELESDDAVRVLEDFFICLRSFNPPDEERLAQLTREALVSNLAKEIIRKRMWEA